LAKLSSEYPWNLHTAGQGIFNEDQMYYLKRIKGDIIAQSETETIRELCERNRADLRGANLRDADLCGANLYNNCYMLPSRFPMIIIEKFIAIGCHTMTIEEWEKQKTTLIEREGITEEEVARYYKFYNFVKELMAESEGGV
jgi:hypothetical protein